MVEILQGSSATYSSRSEIFVNGRDHACTNRGQAIERESVDRVSCGRDEASGAAFGATRVVEKLRMVVDKKASVFGEVANIFSDSFLVLKSR